MQSIYKPSKGSLARRIIRAFQLLCKGVSYLRLPDRNKTNDVVFFVIDPHYQQGGFADRIKAIVSIYYISKINGFKYSLYFEHPFSLSRYLLPNKVNWKCSLDDLNHSICASKLSVFQASYPIPSLKSGYQYHYYWYSGSDIIRLESTLENKECAEEWWHRSFRECYNELFTPSGYLKSLIEGIHLQERTYISVHFRFVNLLGDTEGNLLRFPVLEGKDRKDLINRCLSQLSSIADHNTNTPLYVFSDSSPFLRLCENKGYRVIKGELIGNIAHSHSLEIADKTLLDFYVIGRSQKVYSVVLPGMYSGVFSQYAAIIGGAIFERITE